jgi:hypothetical protein
MADRPQTPAPDSRPGVPSADPAGPDPGPGHIYEVRLTGQVDDLDLLRRLDEVEVTEGELRTVLLGEFASQQELYDLLRRLRSYGLEVLEIRRLPAPVPGEEDP